MTYTQLKGTLLLVLITGLFDINAQNNSLELFTLQPVKEDIENNYVRNATYLELDQVLTADLFASKTTSLELVIPINENEVMTLDLSPNKVLVDNFIVRNSERNEVVDYTPGLYFKGTVNDDPKSIAAISIFEDHIVGMLTYQEQTYVLGHLDQDRYPIGRDYIFYKENDLIIQNEFQCASDIVPRLIKDIKEYTDSADRSVGADNCVNVYFETELDVFQSKGTVANVTNYVTGFYNIVTQLYANENINTAISEIFVWTTTDPFNNNDAFTALNDFGEYRQNNFNGDIAHLITTTNNNNGGIAWLGILCQNYYYWAEMDYHVGPYAYTNIFNTYANFPTYSWTVGAITHEMGHNLGSPHTHSCDWPGGPIDNCAPVEGNCSEGPPPSNGGTIMSYCHATAFGINLNNGFGTLPGDLVRSEVYNANCLSPCSTVASCDPPTNIAAEVISGNVARLSWDAATDAERYRIRYRVGSTGTWVERLTAADETFRFLNALNRNTTYQYQVKTLCAANNSAWSSTFSFTTSSDLCDFPESASTTTQSTSATATWPTDAGDVKWKIQYKRTGVSWTQVTVNNSSYTMTGLSSNTLYKYKLKTKCAIGWTNWGAKFEFTTNASFGGTSEFSTSNSAIRIFPVPTQDQLNLDFGSLEIEQLNVFDVNGYRVFSTNTSSQQINTANLSPGIYFLKLITKDGDILSEKFIKE